MPSRPPHSISLRQFKEMIADADSTNRNLAIQTPIDESDLNPFERLSHEDKALLVYHKKLPLNILKSLCTDMDTRVRRSVAAKRALTEEIFRIMAADADDVVRSTIIDNPNCPRAVLETMLKDRNDWIRDRAAQKLDHRMQS